MQVLRAAGYRRMPWKNGGGETSEIAIAPSGAALDAFDWRVSMAKVSGDGPFSQFPGVDRTLCVLEGHGLRLEVSGHAPIELTTRSAPHTFAADVPTSAWLNGGTITDLNVMTRRGRWLHRARREALAGRRRIDVTGPMLVVSLARSLGVAGAAGSDTLGRFDTLIAAAADSSIELEADGGAEAILIELIACGVSQ